MAAEHQAVEVGRHFVVLRVGGRGRDGNRADAAVGGELPTTGQLTGAVRLGLGAQPGGNHAPDSGADRDVGQQVGLEQPERSR